MIHPEATRGMPRPYLATPSEIDRLLSRAADHPRGTSFLVNGALDSVAATFGVHAFVVEGARQRVSQGTDRAAASAR